jgi:hypothetical protein
MCYCQMLLNYTCSTEYYYELWPYGFSEKTSTSRKLSIKFPLNSYHFGYKQKIQLTPPLWLTLIDMFETFNSFHWHLQFRTKLELQQWTSRQISLHLPMDGLFVFQVTKWCCTLYMVNMVLRDENNNF